MTKKEELIKLEEEYKRFKNTLFMGHPMTWEQHNKDSEYAKRIYELKEQLRKEIH